MHYSGITSGMYTLVTSIQGYVQQPLLEDFKNHLASHESLTKPMSGIKLEDLVHTRASSERT